MLIFRGRDAQFTPSEAVVFNVLLDRYPRSADMHAFDHAINSGRRDGGADYRTIWILIHRVRKKIGPLGMRIIKPSLSEYILGISE